MVQPHRLGGDNIVRVLNYNEDRGRTVDNDVAGGLAHSVLAVIRHLFFVQTLSITMGLFLVLLDVTKGKLDHTVLGLRLVFFGFGWNFISHTTPLIGKAQGHEEEHTWLRVKFHRLFDKNRIIGLTFFAMAIWTNRVIGLYQHLK